MLSRLTADEGAADRFARLPHSAHDVRDALRVDPADGQVVEEVGRLCAVADHVVGAHGDDVLPDRVEPAKAAGNLGLGARAVGSGDEHRVAHVLWQRQHRPEGADAAEQVTTGYGKPFAHQFHRPIAGLNVDAGPGVCRPSAHPVVTSSSLSSINLRLPGSYGTGTGY